MLRHRFQRQNRGYTELNMWATRSESILEYVFLRIRLHKATRLLNKIHSEMTASSICKLFMGEVWSVNQWETWACAGILPVAEATTLNSDQSSATETEIYRQLCPTCPSYLHRSNSKIKFSSMPSLFSCNWAVSHEAKLRPLADLVRLHCDLSGMSCIMFYSPVPPSPERAFLSGWIDHSQFRTTTHGPFWMRRKRNFLLRSFWGALHSIRQFLFVI